MPLAPKWSDQSAADIMSMFLDPQGGSALGSDEPSMASNAQPMLDALGSQHSRDVENQDHMISDPSNPRYQLIDQLMRRNQAKDPYSYDSSMSRMSKAQEATDTMDRFFTQQPMRDRQATDAMNMEEAKKFGHDQGGYESDIGYEGTTALDNAGARDVAKQVAIEKARAALKSGGVAANILGSGEISLPSGMKSDSGNALVNSPRAQEIFRQNGADEGSQGIVGLILDYKLTPPQAAALARSGQMQKYLGLAKAIDGQFDPSSFETGMKLRADLTTGKSADVIQSLNRIKEHMGSLRGGIKELNNVNTGGGIVNPLVNWWQQQMQGDERVARYKKEQAIVDAESAKAMNASGVSSDASRQEQAAGVDYNSSQRQQYGHADVTDELLHGQATALRNKISAVPRLLPLLDELMKGVNAEPQGNAAHAAPTATPAAGPTIGQEGNVNGIPAIWDGQHWRRKP